MEAYVEFVRAKREGMVNGCLLAGVRHLTPVLFTCVLNHLCTYAIKLGIYG